MEKKIKLSIVILNYNTAELTNNCLDSIKKNPPDSDYEIIVIDNGSQEKLTIEDKNVIIVKNKENLGFGRGNNKARDVAKGEYVLFLNSDILIQKETLKKTVKYMDGNPEVGAFTCKTILPSGELDKDSRRSFPTPWVAFTHFSGLDRIFPKSRLFSKYWYGYISPDKIQEVNVLQGAFFLARKKILDEVDWFDEDYFLDGEDVDLCWKIKEKGWKIVYFPEVSIIHIKKATKNLVKGRYKGQGVDSMEIFYRKHLWNEYPLVLNWLVVLGIKLIRLIRTI